MNYEYEMRCILKEWICSTCQVRNDHIFLQHLQTFTKKSRKMQFLMFVNIFHRVYYSSDMHIMRTTGKFSSLQGICPPILALLDGSVRTPTTAAY